MAEQHTLSRRFFCAGSLMALSASLLIPSYVTRAWADEAEDKQAEADAAFDQLMEMQNSLDRASNDYHKAIEARDEASARMDDAEQKASAASEQVESYKAQLSERARAMYRSGGNTFLEVILGSATFKEFATNWSMLNTMNEQDAALVAQSKAVRAELIEARSQYALQKTIAEHEADEAYAVQQEAMQTVQHMQEIYQALSSEAAELLAQKQREAYATDVQSDAVANQNTWIVSSDTPTPNTTPNTNTENHSNPDPDGTTSNNPAPTPAPEPPAPSPAPVPNEPETTALGDAIVQIALQYLGYDYVWGGKSPAYGGFDCSGFVAYCYGQAGSWAPSYTGSLISWGHQVSSPAPGDVCVIHEANGSQHTGIYYQNGQMIHAATFGVGVIIGPVQAGMQYRRP